jgi:glutamate-1-semialdehyde 2,1-aminomutase
MLMAMNILIMYCSWGPSYWGIVIRLWWRLFGKQPLKGTSYGAPCENEIELAQAICKAIPSIEMVRMVNSGTEATMSAIRLARAFTGRNRIVKFEGCYHGHADSFLIKAGSGLMTAGVPNSGSTGQPGRSDPGGVLYNDIESVELLFQQYGTEIAAVIVEPIAGNMGLVPPRPDFLPALRK